MATANPQAAWNEVGLLSPKKRLEGTYLLGSGLEKVTETLFGYVVNTIPRVLSENRRLNYQRNRCQTSFD